MNESEIVVRAPAESCVAGHNGRLYPKKDARIFECPTNLDLTTQQGKALVMAAGNPGDLEFDKNGVADIVAVYYLIFPEEGTDPETGELGTYARTVLFDAEGNTFRTSSAHAPHRIAAALDLYSVEEWQRGIHFLIRQRMGKRGRLYHDIRIHPDMVER